MTITASQEKATNPMSSVVASEEIRFPKTYAVIKWAIIGSLAFLAIVAAAFWAFVLGGFAGSGFHASDPARKASEDLSLIHI